MIVSFMRMNMKIEQSGNFDLLDKKDLYKLIASNNTVNTNVLSKVKPMHMFIHIHMQILYFQTRTVPSNTYCTNKHVLYLQLRTVLTNTYCTYNEQLGLFEGSDAAWENADYHITLEGEQCYNQHLIFPHSYSHSCTFTCSCSCSHSYSYSRTCFYFFIFSTSTIIVNITIPSSSYS
jgi:hypothetical protein